MPNEGSSSGKFVKSRKILTAVLIIPRMVPDGLTSYRSTFPFLCLLRRQIEMVTIDSLKTVCKYLVEKS